MSVSGIATTQAAFRTQAAPPPVSSAPAQQPAHRSERPHGPRGSGSAEALTTTASAASSATGVLGSLLNVVT